MTVRIGSVWDSTQQGLAGRASLLVPFAAIGFFLPAMLQVLLVPQTSMAQMSASASATGVLVERDLLGHCPSSPRGRTRRPGGSGPGTPTVESEGPGSSGAPTTTAPTTSRCVGAVGGAAMRCGTT